MPVGINVDTQASMVTMLPFPRDDVDFRREIDALREATMNGEPDPGELETRLRVVYPHAIVRRRIALGALDPTIETWYVYRDGEAAPKTT